MDRVAGIFLKRATSNSIPLVQEKINRHTNYRNISSRYLDMWCLVYMKIIFIVYKKVSSLKEETVH